MIILEKRGATAYRDSNPRYKGCLWTDIEDVFSWMNEMR